MDSQENDESAKGLRARHRIGQHTCCPLEATCTLKFQGKCHSHSHWGAGPAGKNVPSMDPLQGRAKRGSNSKMPPVPTPNFAVQCVSENAIKVVAEWLSGALAFNLI